MKKIILILILLSVVSLGKTCKLDIQVYHTWKIVCVEGYQWLATGYGAKQMFKISDRSSTDTVPIPCTCWNKK